MKALQHRPGDDGWSHTDATAVRAEIHRHVADDSHREDEYESTGFDVLLAMQQEHFWYRGRHRFLLRAFQNQVSRLSGSSGLRLVDLGGGCGGWLKYLCERSDLQASEIALADSSIKALEYSADTLPSSATRYQIDLLQLEWTNHWNVAFLLDVLEHIPDDVGALREIHSAMAPNGVLFVTTPAIQKFWSWNDDLAHHVRRYSKYDFRELAASCGFELIDVRYFMFLLSPLLLVSRWFSQPASNMSDEEQKRRMRAAHQVPHPLVNSILGGVFAAETPVGHHVPFPWGTSILGVFRKPGVRT